MPAGGCVTNHIMQLNGRPFVGNCEKNHIVTDAPQRLCATISPNNLNSPARALPLRQAKPILRLPRSSTLHGRTFVFLRSDDPRALLTLGMGQGCPRTAGAWTRRDGARPSVANEMNASD